MKKRSAIANRSILAASLSVVIASLCGCDASPPRPDDANAEGQALYNDALAAMRPADQQAFAGKGQLGGELASINVPASPEEVAYLSDPSSGDRFLAFASEKYPEIRKVKFRPDADIRSDPESYAMYRQSFYIGLYFAERIRLADGQSLFEFLTRCSASVDPTTGADVNSLAKPRPGFGMQFFPVLREADGTATDLQILLDREGDVITARSPLFSSSVLKSPSFMSDHGVVCAQ